MTFIPKILILTSITPGWFCLLYTSIAGEVGGMGESLARLSEMVSAPEEKARLIEASNCFDSPAFYEPLS